MAAWGLLVHRVHMNVHVYINLGSERASRAGSGVRGTLTTIHRVNMNVHVYINLRKL